MKSDDQSGPHGRIRRNEIQALTGEDLEGDLRTISVEWPECRTDTTLYDIVSERRCAGYLYDLTDYDATLSFDLVTRNETG